MNKMRFNKIINSLLLIIFLIGCHKTSYYRKHLIADIFIATYEGDNRKSLVKISNNNTSLRKFISNVNMVAGNNKFLIARSYNQKDSLFLHFYIDIQEEIDNWNYIPKEITSQLFDSILSNSTIDYKFYCPLSIHKDCFEKSEINQEAIILKTQPLSNRTKYTQISDLIFRLPKHV